MPDRFDHIAFGSSGIRGPYATTATPELALALGAAAAAQADRLVVGRDARTTGPTLEAAFVAGALSRGAEVACAGIVPTPTLAHGARRYVLGLQITASHNPAPDNGFKFWTPTGAALGAEDRERLLAELAKPPAPVPWDAVGRPIYDPRIAPDHAAALLDAVGTLDGSPRVVVDCGNGAASRFSPRLLARAGAQVVTLNAQHDGTFPGRPSEPVAGNLTDLAAAVAASDAVCGLAHDGDADRCVAVDERGRVVPGDALLVLLVRELGARRVALPVDTSRQVTDALEGVEVRTTPVGDAFVSAALAEHGGDFGGEPSGALIFPEVSLCPDGPHAALLVARIAAAHGGLAALVDALPQYATVRRSVDLGDAPVEAAMAHIAEALRSLGPTHELDGVRVDLDDGWALVRPSGTEPKLRVTCEARERAAADALSEKIAALVARALAEVRP